MPNGMPTISASTNPVKNSFADSRNWRMNSPLHTNCQSATTVAENGTMKAWLVLRPAISQAPMPMARLIQTGAWRRMTFSTTTSLHHRIGVLPDAGVDQVGVGHRFLVRLDGADLL